MPTRVETSGIRFDHIELSFTYFTSSHLKAFNAEMEAQTLDRLKAFNVRLLRRMLQEYAYAGIERPNAYAPKRHKRSKPLFSVSVN